jgi:TonB-linked SusC/RagA family outer membrane protein
MHFNFYYECLYRAMRPVLKTILMMKLIFVIILISCMQVSAVSYSQTVTLSEKNSSLQKIFKQISKQVDYNFLYTDELLQNSKSVTIDVKNMPLEQVLQACFANQPLTYKVFDNTVVLKSKTGADADVELTPPLTVKGKVVDDKGEPLPGVVIKVKGTQLGASTDVYGNYTIILQNPKSTLVFSFVGFEPQEVNVDGRMALNITLLPNSKALNEVVVIGYGTQKRGDVSGAIASVNMAKLKDVPVTNLSTALQGRVPGLVAVPTSYRPGSGSSIRIRGTRSLTAGNDPLYVVDGVPITYSIDDINPLDIESIDVLKDAAATAVYGSRGANGVIQVTTKKGKAGKLTIDYNGNTSFDNIVKKLDIYNGPEFAQFKRDAFIGSGIYNNTLSATNPNKQYFPDPASDYKLFSGDPILWQSVLAGYNFTQLDPANNIFVYQTRPTTAAEQAVMRSLGYPVQLTVAVYDPSKVPTFDWQSLALRTGVSQNHNLSITGGSEKFRSSFSMGYYNQKGIEYGQDYTRYSFSSSTNFKPVSALDFGANVSYSNAIQNTGPDEYSGASGQFPFSQPYDANGNFILFPGNDGNVVNPLNDRNTVFNENRINRLLANIYAQVSIIKGLDYKIAFGADMNDARLGVFNGAVSSVSVGNPASASYQTQYGFVWTLQNQLSYNHTFGRKNAITATVVQELQKDRSEASRFAATNLSYESQKWYSLQNNTLGTVTSATLSPSTLLPFAQHQLVGYLGRFNYSYDGKYIVTLGVRHDASSVLPPTNNSQTFPSGSVAWRIDAEPFMKNVTFVDQLKLRAGIGSVGNSGIQPYTTGGQLTTTPTYYNFGATAAEGYAPLQQPLLDLTWEKTTTKNIALDYAFFKNRISGSIDVYQSNSNEIQRQSIPAASGYSYYTVNLGVVRNSGIEVSLSTVNIDKGKGFKWTTDFVFSTNKESIVSLSNTNTDDIGNQWFLGHPVRSYVDYKSQGIFQYADTLAGGILKDYFWKKAGNKTNPNFQPGRIRVQDVSGDTVITDADKVYLGSPNPKWTASINNTFSYKGFDLSTFVYISYGALVRDIRPGLVGRYESVKVNYWTPTNPSNDYQQPNTTSDIPLYWQALSFRDGSFIRIRSILLTYHVPENFLKKFKLSNMSLSVNAVNPFLFSRYKRYDPETVPYTSTYPSSSTANPAATSFSYRSFVFGLRVGL